MRVGQSLESSTSFIYFIDKNCVIQHKIGWYGNTFLWICKSVIDRKLRIMKVGNYAYFFITKESGEFTNMVVIFLR